MQQHVQDHYVPAISGGLCLGAPMSVCTSDVVGLACHGKASSMEIASDVFANQSPFGLPAQQVDAQICDRSKSFPAQRESSCLLPETPQPGKPLPAIRTRTCDSDLSIITPIAGSEQQQQQHAEEEWSQPCAGWFFSCRGCGCMTAYEQQFAGVDVPFCRRCQVLLIEAKPAMQQKMMETLLYVHHAWAKAGL